MGQIKTRGVGRDLRFSPTAGFIYLSIQKKKKYITLTFFQKKEKKKGKYVLVLDVPRSDPSSACISKNICIPFPTDLKT